jgi:hypothetical protein
MSESLSNPVATEESAPRTIKFEYIKGNFFRTARSDGAWAGTNGRTDLVLNFYSERTPIPKQTVHALNDQYVLGPEIVNKRSSLDGMVREVEISISMNLDVARALKDLLEKQITAIESARISITGDDNK